MDTRATLIVMARGSISNGYAKHGVSVSKHAVQMVPMVVEDMVSIGTPYHHEELEVAFQHCMDLSEAANG